MAMSSEFTYDPAPPEERIADAHRLLHDRLAAQLLREVKSAPPAFFEHLVLDLLLAIGYGHRPLHPVSSIQHPASLIKHHDSAYPLTSATLTGGTGDGGIDGIIHQDPLGLDPIYLQAKRWEHPIGEPHLRDFIGALDQVRGHKGVFITTSTFTEKAHTCARLATSNIVLIDGEHLAQLMIDHNIGVTPAHVYEIKTLNPDYFAE